MSFLKKLGTVVLKIIGIATGVMPLIQSALPAGAQGEVATIEDKLNKSLGVIVTAEQMFAAAGSTKAGSAKLMAAKPFISQLMQQTELLVGKTPKNEAAYETAITNLTSAFADVLNAYGD